MRLKRRTCKIIGDGIGLLLLIPVCILMKNHLDIDKGGFTLDKVDYSKYKDRNNF